MLIAALLTLSQIVGSWQCRLDSAKHYDWKWTFFRDHSATIESYNAPLKDSHHFNFTFDGYNLIEKGGELYRVKYGEVFSGDVVHGVYHPRWTPKDHLLTVELDEQWNAIDHTWNPVPDPRTYTCKRAGSK
jgi:hypothetical protein